MSTEAELTADIAAIDSALTKGVRAVTMASGESIEYSNSEGMRAQKAAKIRELNALRAAGAGGRAGYSLADFSGG